MLFILMLLVCFILTFLSFVGGFITLVLIETGWREEGTICGIISIVLFIIAVIVMKGVITY